MSTNPTSRLPIPITILKPAFKSIISDVIAGVKPSGSTFWASCYRQKHPSVHATIHVEVDEKNRDVVNLVPKEGDIQISRQIEGNKVRALSVEQKGAIVLIVFRI
jgi:hypothetical protein